MGDRDAALEFGNMIVGLTGCDVEPADRDLLSKSITSAVPSLLQFISFYYRAKSCFDIRQRNTQIPLVCSFMAACVLCLILGFGASGFLHSAMLVGVSAVVEVLYLVLMWNMVVLQKRSSAWVLWRQPLRMITAALLGAPWVAVALAVVGDGYGSSMVRDSTIVASVAVMMFTMWLVCVRLVTGWTAKYGATAEAAKKFPCVPVTQIVIVCMMLRFDDGGEPNMRVGGGSRTTMRGVAASMLLAGARAVESGLPLAMAPDKPKERRAAEKRAREVGAWIRGQADSAQLGSKEESAALAKELIGVAILMTKGAWKEVPGVPVPPPVTVRTRVVLATKWLTVTFLPPAVLGVLSVTMGRSAEVWWQLLADVAVMWPMLRIVLLLEPAAGDLLLKMLPLKGSGKD